MFKANLFLLFVDVASTSHITLTYSSLYLTTVHMTDMKLTPYFRAKMIPIPAFSISKTTKVSEKLLLILASCTSSSPVNIFKSCTFSNPQLCFN